MQDRVVIALGGNALIKKGQQGTIYEQFANTRAVAESIVRIMKNGWNVVLTHGNGPQVGSILLQNEAGKDLTPSMPLGICVAESQGLLGYMIQQCLSNAFQKHQMKKEVVTLLTQVVVDEDDPAMKHPTKPVGPFYDKQRAQELRDEGYNVVQQQKGWRIVVPSPNPIEIVEGSIINTLVKQGTVVIAAGGGGMPVIQKKNWGYDGVEAVVDKDLTAERIAEAVQANVLMILTNVEYIYRGFGTDNQQSIPTISLNELKKLFRTDEFPAGSMGPKVQAAIRFLETGGKKVIIGHVDNAEEALMNNKATIITS